MLPLLLTKIANREILLETESSMKWVNGRIHRVDRVTRNLSYSFVNTAYVMLTTLYHLVCLISFSFHYVRSRLHEMSLPYFLHPVQPIL
jgi:hypothetical protein